MINLDELFFYLQGIDRLPLPRINNKAYFPLQVESLLPGRSGVLFLLKTLIRLYEN